MSSNGINSSGGRKGGQQQSSSPAAAGILMKGIVVDNTGRVDKLEEAVKLLLSICAEYVYFRFRFLLLLRF